MPGPAPGPGRRMTLPADAEKGAAVEAMFDRIAPRYDRLNRIISLGQDRRWRRHTVAALRLPPGLVLEQTLPGPAWYIHRELLEGDERCLLQRALEDLALHAAVNYFRDLRVVRPCDAQ